MSFRRAFAKLAALVAIAAAAVAQPIAAQDFVVAGYLPEYRWYIDVEEAVKSLTDLILFSVAYAKLPPLLARTTAAAAAAATAITSSNCRRRLHHHRHHCRFCHGFYHGRITSNLPTHRHLPPQVQPMPDGRVDDHWITPTNFRRARAAADAAPHVVNVIISVGGAGRSHYFTRVASDTKLRRKFVLVGAQHSTLNTQHSTLNTQHSTSCPAHSRITVPTYRFRKIKPQGVEAVG